MMKTLNWRLSIVRRALGVALFSPLLAMTGLPANHARAEQSGDAPCAERLRMFVLKIDELFASKTRDREQYYAVIREYLPSKGCTVEEVISASKKSKFVLPAFDQSAAFDHSAAYVIVFKNSDLHVTFGVQKDTGIIDYPAVLSNQDSW